MKIKNTVVFILLLFGLLSVPVFAENSRVADKTLMIYMVGSNLESQNGSASIDLQEILGSDVDPEKVNVLIFTGGALQWHSDIPNDRNTIQQVTKREQGLTLTRIWENDAAVSMGDAAALSEFLNYCTENVPSEEYSLIFWDHGSGPVQGFGYDELFEGDQLSLNEIQTAMDQTDFGTERKLSWVGFDACLMASLEIADTMAPYADYMIASQEVEPGNGWNYAFLSEMTENQEVSQLAQEIVDQYVSFYHSQDYIPELTMSCTDLQKIPELTMAVDALCAEMIDGLDEGGYAQFAKERAVLKNFGESSSGGSTQGPDLVDLYTLAESMQEQYPEEAQSVLTLLSEIITCRSTDISEANGLSVYYPYHNLSYYLNYGQSTLQQSVENSAYQNYMTRFMQQMQDTSQGIEWISDNEKRTDQEYQLYLTEEQMEVFSSAYLNIWQIVPEYNDNAYYRVVSDLSLLPDQDGILHVDLDQKYYVLAGKHDDTAVVRVSQTSSERRKRIFSTISTFAQTNSSSIASDPYKEISVNFSTNLSGENIEIQRIYETVDEEESAILGNRMDIDLSHWTYLAAAYGGRNPRYSANGGLLPQSEWEHNSILHGEVASINEGMFIEERSCADAQDRAFFGQVEWVDVYGNTHAAGGLFPLNEGYEECYQEISTETEKGTLIWQLDLTTQSVILCSYSGEDEELEIPESINGYEVTGIQTGFMNTNESLKKITVPETITYLLNGTFYSGLNGQLETILLPQNIELLDSGVFRGCRNLKEVFFVDEKKELTEKGLFYTISSGTVFSKDQKSLIAYFSGNQIRKYVIPDGVERIEDYAFYGNHYLTEVEFPETIKFIGINAFGYCNDLWTIHLPESLESIGHYAFSKLYADLPEYLEKSQSVYIGKSVSYIGEGAFLAYPAKAIEVSEENKTYSSKDGLLLNKAGDTLLAFPRGMDESIQIPDGITYVSDDCFSYEYSIEELYFPDSVQTIGKNEFPSSLKKIRIGAGLKTLPDLYLREDLEIEISPENPYLMIQNEMIMSKDGTILYEILPTADFEEVCIPEGVIYIKNLDSDLTEKIERISFPSTVKNLDPLISSNGWDQLQYISIAEEHLEFSSENGLLLDKDESRLIKCPSCMDTIQIPETVTEIGSYAVYNLQKASTIVIPEGVEVIREENFAFDHREEAVVDLYLPDSLRECSEYTFEYNDAAYQIHCTEGSFGQLVAEEHDLECIFTDQNAEDSDETEPASESSDEEMEDEESEENSSADTEETEDTQEKTSDFAIVDAENENLTEQEFQLSLPEGQTSVVAANMHIFMIPLGDTVTETGCLPVVMSIPVMPEADGNFHIDRDQKYYVLKGACDQEMIVPVTQTEENDSEKKFQISFFNVCAGYSMQEPRMKLEGEFNSSVTDGTVKSQSFYEATEGKDISAEASSEIDWTKWNSVGYELPLYSINDSENGQILDLYHYLDYRAGYTISVADSLTVEERSCSEAVEMAFCAVVQWKDSEGNLYRSHLFPLNEVPEEVNRTLITKTEQGNLTWILHLQNQTATLKEYSGEDEELMIPETVEGYEVVGIGNYFLKEAENLKKISIPKSITYLSGTISLSDARNLETIILPENIEFLEPGIFEYMHELKQIWFEDGDGVTSAKGENYQMVDHAIYSSDGKTLEAWLEDDEEIEVTIPEGVEKIEDDAFYGNEFLTEVHFPESLQSIGYGAFMDCTYLQNLVFPESLQSIGAYAFDKNYSYDVPDFFGETETIEIGANITFIGQGAFHEYTLYEFHVSPDNMVYSSVDGLLLSKNGETLLCLPRKMKGSVVLPDGIRTLAEDSISRNGETEELYLPDSLEKIADLRMPRNLKKLIIGAGLKEIEAYDDFISEDTEVLISEENPYFTVENGTFQAIEGEGE